MKLFGNSRKNGHSGGKRTAANTQAVQRQAAAATAKKKPKKKSKAKKAILVIVIVLLVFAAAAFAAYRIYVKPPVVNETKRPDTEGVAEGIDNGTKPNGANRNDGIYTFVVLGMDDGNGNTDTIMVVTFDTNEHTVNVVSIPRDTLVNVDWAVKKANTLYAYGDTKGVVDGLADLIGYEVDFYVIVDLEAFEVLVDAIGGVDYNVPVDMYYVIPELNIDLKAGMQHLTGEQAIGVVRFRSGYANADIGRISTQQDFLKTVAKQIIENKNSINISTLAKVFLQYVKTDLTYGNLVWMAQEFLKVDPENVNFYTLPGNYGDSINQGGLDVSYVTIYIDEWLKMINEYLNPFDKDITLEDLSILTRDASGALVVFGRDGSTSYTSPASAANYTEPTASYVDDSSDSSDEYYDDSGEDYYEESSSSDTSGSSSESESESVPEETPAPTETPEETPAPTETPEETPAPTETPEENGGE